MDHNYHLIKLPEREHWSDEVKSLTQEIYGVYAYDAAEYTYCAEATPSHCLMYIGVDYIPVEDLEEDKLEELHTWIEEGSTYSEPVTYMHVASVVRRVEAKPELTKKAEIEFDLEDISNETARWNAIFDQLIEGWHTGALRY